MWRDCGSDLEANLLDPHARVLRVSSPSRWGQRKSSFSSGRIERDRLAGCSFPSPMGGCGRLGSQGRWLARGLQGHYNYSAVPDNSEALHGFRRRLIRLWLQALRRRSQKDRLTWKRMLGLEARWLPEPRIQHPWPNRRFDARTQGRSPVRLTRTLGLCGGAACNGGPYRCARHDQLVARGEGPFGDSSRTAGLVRSSLTV